MGAVKFKGSGNRVISKQDWESLKITDQDTLVWSEENNFMVDEKDIKSGAKSWLTQQTDQFEFVTPDTKSQEK